MQDPYTPEWEVKTVVWKILQSGINCKIHKLNLPLDSMASSEVISKELAVQIVEYSRDYEEWLAIEEDKPLLLRNAVKIAKSAIALLSGSELSIELESLQLRCGCNSYKWGQIMKEVEKEFYQELERRGIKSKQEDSKDEKLRLSLLALLKETDPIKLIRKRGELRGNRCLL